MMEVNGKNSAGKIIKALNICYFLMKNKAEKENVQIKYFPTDEIQGCFMTNPMQGEKFGNSRN